MIRKLTEPSTRIPGVDASREDIRASMATVPLSLEKLHVSVMRGTYPEDMQRRLYKRLGYSLQGYYELFGRSPRERGWRA
jgi:hypothetical protein